jgi:hypothetical protein
MSLDSDVALLGTGVAPLVAASYLLAQGKSVLLLNPDWDFFLEDSELPLDPLLQKTPTIDLLKSSSPEQALSILRPDFPGPIEFWSPQTDSHSSGPEGFHDPSAPHVRQRGRLWISSSDRDRFWNWEALEDLYVEAADAGLNPQILDGIAATKRFPGFSGSGGNYRGLYIPKIYDVDINRYRNELLEFIRERVGSKKVICALTQLERMPEGIRFHYQGASHTAKLNHGMLVFWTPRLTPWILQQAKKAETKPRFPQGVQLWEQWTLNSRDAPDVNTVGMFRDMAVWSDFEGLPPHHPRNERKPTLQSITPRLGILRAGPLIPLDGLNLPQVGMSWASTESFSSLWNLCHGFLKWDRFSVRGMKPRAVFEWSQPEQKSPWFLSNLSPWIQVIPACDGPLVNVVRVARSACESLLKES